MMVKLVCKEQTLSIPVGRAERLLRLQAKIHLTSWQLPDDSPYQLVDGKLIKRGNKKVVSGKTKKERD